jgi:hypothetical protein
MYFGYPTWQDPQVIFSTHIHIHRVWNPHVSISTGLAAIPTHYSNGIKKDCRAARRATPHETPMGFKTSWHMLGAACTGTGRAGAMLVGSRRWGTAPGGERQAGSAPGRGRTRWRGADQWPHTGRKGEGREERGNSPRARRTAATAHRDPP